MFKLKLKCKQKHLVNILSGMLKTNKIYSIHVVQLFIAPVPVRRFCSWYSFPSAVHRCRATGKANITIQVADIVVFHCYTSSSSPLLPLGLHRSSGHWSWIMAFAHLAFKFWEVVGLLFPSFNSSRVRPAAQSP